MIPTSLDAYKGGNKKFGLVSLLFSFTVIPMAYLSVQAAFRFLSNH